jgi:hypothetical protein
VDTLAWRMHIRWDEAALATPHVPLMLFAEFLAATGVFDPLLGFEPDGLQHAGLAV